MKERMNELPKRLSAGRVSTCRRQVNKEEEKADKGKMVMDEKHQGHHNLQPQLRHRRRHRHHRHRHRQGQQRRQILGHRDRQGTLGATRWSRGSDRQPTESGQQNPQQMTLEEETPRRPRNQQAPAARREVVKTVEMPGEHRRIDEERRDLQKTNPTILARPTRTSQKCPRSTRNCSADAVEANSDPGTNRSTT